MYLMEAQKGEELREKKCYDGNNHKRYRSDNLQFDHCRTKVCNHRNKTRPSDFGCSVYEAFDCCITCLGCVVYLDCIAKSTRSDCYRIINDINYKVRLSSTAKKQLTSTLLRDSNQGHHL